MNLIRKRDREQRIKLKARCAGGSQQAIRRVAGLQHGLVFLELCLHAKKTACILVSSPRLEGAVCDPFNHVHFGIKHGRFGM
jgi:hypothetical protein